jgi:hypothetical protein
MFWRNFGLSTMLYGLIQFVIGCYMSSFYEFCKNSCADAGLSGMSIGLIISSIVIFIVGVCIVVNNWRY